MWVVPDTNETAYGDCDPENGAWCQMNRKMHEWTENLIDPKFERELTIITGKKTLFGEVCTSITKVIVNDNLINCNSKPDKSSCMTIQINLSEKYGFKVL